MKTTSPKFYLGKTQMKNLYADAAGIKWQICIHDMYHYVLYMGTCYEY